ncbi:hypothetical protein MMC27_003587 [Xylographa pallens]|nr:hypothetical protein [Xylographa pallens]
MDKLYGLDTEILSDDEQGSAPNTGSTSRKNGRIPKRPYSSLANDTSDYRPNTEEHGSPSKASRTSLGQQSFSDQVMPYQSRRLLPNKSLGNDQGFEILYSGKLRKRQARPSIIDIDDDEVDNGDDDGNPNRSDLLFTFDHVNNAASNPAFPAGITVEDCMSDEDFHRYMANQQEPNRYNQSSVVKSRLPSTAVHPARIVMQKHNHHGIQLGIGVNVELQNGDFLRITGIQKDSYSMNILLRGRLFRRMRFMNGAIEKKLNEVCLIENINQSDVRSHAEQALIEVDVNNVLRRRGLRMTNRPYPELSFREEDYRSEMSVIINERVLVCRWRYVCFFPNERALQKNAHCEKALIALRSDEVDGKWTTNDENLRRNFRGHTAKGGASSTFTPVELARIQEEQDSARKASDRSGDLLPTTPTRSSSFDNPGSSFDTPLDVDLPMSRMSLEPVDFWSNGLRQVSNTTHNANPRVNMLRQQATRHSSNSSNGTVIDLTLDEKDYSRRQETQPESDSDSTVTGDDNIAAADLVPRKLQRYTFGDGFCGCGGVSRGATIAGLSLRWAFDFENPMCTSYRRNFPATRVFCSDAFDFATIQDFNAKVDILHLSPPCQYFSPAHTSAGINDERNTASSFVIFELLKKAKPRIVTLENTLGLEQRHPLYLHAVIQQFTVLGFSIRWKTIDLRDYGVPQSRRRLIIIAACPGEILPDFPAPTHSKSPETTGLKPWATINESISTITRDWPDHDISKANRTPRQPFDGNTQAKCMTTGGGIGNYHPSGRRGYTIREYACLQTFPLEHEWDPLATLTLRRQQIGNAVPPIFYAALARKIVQSLKKTDGLVEVNDLTIDPQPPRNEERRRQSFGSYRPGNIQRATTYRFQ